MPAVLIVEAMAQVGGVLLLSTSGFEGKLALFGGMDKLRFRRLVRPGDQLIMEVEIIKWRRDAGRVRVVGKVDGQVAAHGEYLFVFMKEGDSAETSMAEEEG
jgi:3-hydroxyacyl-[acyl-carrier-protein] dehydratase